MVTEGQVKAAQTRLNDAQKAVVTEAATVETYIGVATEQDANAKLKKYQQLRDRETFALLNYHKVRMQYVAKTPDTPAPKKGK